MPAEEDENGQPSFWNLLEELGIVVTIPTFLIIVLQVTVPACVSHASDQQSFSAL